MGCASSSQQSHLTHDSAISPPVRTETAVECSPSRSSKNEDNGSLVSEERVFGVSLESLLVREIRRGFHHGFEDDIVGVADDASSGMESTLLERARSAFCIPVLIVDLVAFLTSEDSPALHREGLFRIAPSHTRKLDFISRIDSGERILFLEECRDDPDLVASLFTHFLRALPSSIVGDDLRSWIEVGELISRASSLSKNDEKLQLENHALEILQQILESLIPPSQALLCVLCRVLEQVDMYSADTRMGFENLARVFTPTLFQSLTDLRYIDKLVAALRFLFEKQHIVLHDVEGKLSARVRSALSPQSEGGEFAENSSAGQQDLQTVSETQVSQPIALYQETRSHRLSQQVTILSGHSSNASVLSSPQDTTGFAEASFPAIQPREINSGLVQSSPIVDSSTPAFSSTTGKVRIHETEGQDDPSRIQLEAVTANSIMIKHKEHLEQTRLRHDQLEEEADRLRQLVEKQQAERESILTRMNSLEESFRRELSEVWKRLELLSSPPQMQPHSEFSARDHLYSTVSHDIAKDIVSQQRQQESVLKDYGTRIAVLSDEVDRGSVSLSRMEQTLDVLRAKVDATNARVSRIDERVEHFEAKARQQLESSSRVLLPSVSANSSGSTVARFSSSPFLSSSDPLSISSSKSQLLNAKVYPPDSDSLKTKTSANPPNDGSATSSSLSCSTPMELVNQPSSKHQSLLDLVRSTFPEPSEIDDGLEHRSNIEKPSDARAYSSVSQIDQRIEELSKALDSPNYPGLSRRLPPRLR